MEIQTISSKRTIPPLNTRIVKRTRLVEKINHGVGRKFTLICAPAGFGKTVLIQDWINQINQDVVWLNIDETDNEIWNLITNAISAFQESIPEFGKALSLEIHAQKSKLTIHANPTTLISGLIRELETTESVCIVFDDFHHITNKDTLDALLFFVKHLPDHIHVLITTRTEPFWPLARMRSQSAFTEIRENDLRFSITESTAFLNGIVGLDLSEFEINELVSRTEGWISGLQLASISMKHHPDIAVFLKNFTSSNRYIMDYLTEEVLAGLPDNQRNFLLKTSCLNRFNHSLCNHITGKSNSQEIIIELQNNNLFLVPLDENNTWFRYHHLFADYLRNEFRRKSPSEYKKINSLASAWWIKNGFVGEAISHAFLAEDLESVDRLITGNVLSWISQGNIYQLNTWLETLPEQIIARNLWLSLAKIWVALQSGNFQIVGDLTAAFEDQIEGKPSKRVNERILGHFYLVKAYASFLGWISESSLQNAKEEAEKALDHLDNGDQSEIIWAHTIIAGACHGMGRLIDAEKTFEFAIAQSKTSGDEFARINLMGEYIDLLLTKGQLYKAQEICLEGLSLNQIRESKLQPQSIGYLHTRFSMIYRQWNQLDDALKHARRGLEISEAWGQADVIIIGMYQLAKVLASIGKNKDAKHTINKAKLMAANMSEIYKEMVETWQVRIHDMCGDHTAGARWIRDNTLDSLNQSLRPMWKTMVIVRVLISQGRYQECESLTNELLKISTDSGAQGYEITLLILLTKCYLKLGKENHAIQTLERALYLAEPENNIRDFIDDGNRPVNTLLKKWIESKENAKFALKITKAYQQEKKSETEMPLTNLITPLSNREHEVLELLATECSPSDIAARLFISVSTVNSHIRNIYGKLGVNKRYEAVKLANELKIIQ